MTSSIRSSSAAGARSDHIWTKDILIGCDWQPKTRSWGDDLSITRLAHWWRTPSFIRYFTVEETRHAVYQPDVGSISHKLPYNQTCLCNQWSLSLPASGNHHQHISSVWFELWTEHSKHSWFFISFHFMINDTQRQTSGQICILCFVVLKYCKIY